MIPPDIPFTLALLCAPVALTITINQTRAAWPAIVQLARQSKGL